MIITIVGPSFEPFVKCLFAPVLTGVRCWFMASLMNPFLVAVWKCQTTGFAFVPSVLMLFQVDNFLRGAGEDKSAMVAFFKLIMCKSFVVA